MLENLMSSAGDRSAADRQIARGGRLANTFLRPWPMLGLSCLLLPAAILAGLAAPAAATEYAEAERLLDGGARAVVWYLGHSGWAVRTKSHLLVFDYWEYRDRPAGGGMAAGFIDPEEIAEARVRVFVSHRHSDHYDAVIHTWKEHVKDIKYVFGWAPEEIKPEVAFGTERETVAIGEMSVANVHHAFDGLPESAFLVSADGVVIYHAGDHGHRAGLDNPTYKSNLDYLASLHERVDLAFVPVFGGEDAAIDKLAPRVAVPMHSRFHDAHYAEFERRAGSRHPGVRVFAAAQPGDSFVY